MSSSDASTHGTARAESHGNARAEKHDNLRAGSHDTGNEILLDAPREKSVSIGFSLSLLIIAFIVRLAIGWSMSGSLDSDPDAYATLAKTWAQTGTYGLIDQAGVAHPTAYRPAMYPWILSWFILSTNWKTWIILLHACLGAMTAYWTFAVGHRLRLSKFISLLAMSFVLFDPILLRQSTLVMTETLATWFAMGIWWTYLLGVSTSRTRGGAWFVTFWSVLGVLLGFACLSRPTSLMWAVLWSGVELKRNVRGGALLMLGCVLVLTPWWYRNAQVFHEGVWTTTHGGYTLLLANNPVLLNHWQHSASREWDEEAFHTWWQERSEGVQGELQRDRLANSLAMKSIEANPLGFIYGIGIRQLWFWAWWPSERQAGLGLRWLIGFWYSAVTCAVIYGCWSLGKRWDRRVFGSALWNWMPALSMAFSLCAIHSVYWSNMRMRSPLIPLVSLLAAYGLQMICERYAPSTLKTMFQSLSKMHTTPR